MNRIVTFKKNDIFFYIAFFLYFVTKYTEYTSIDNSLMNGLCSIGKNFSYALCFLIILIDIKVYTKVGLKKIIVQCVLFALVAYQVVFNDGKSIFVVLLFSYAFENRDFKRFLRFTYWLNVVCFSATILLSSMGITRNVITEQEKLGVMWSRMSLGFNYPGQLMMSLIPIVFLYYYLNIEKINLLINILWVLVIGIFYIFCQTIMPALVCFGFIVASNCMRKLARWKYVYWVVPIFAIVTLVVLYLYSQKVSLASLIDRISNYRFSLGMDAVEKYGISLWGTGFQNIYTEAKYLILDSEYMFMLISNGIIYLIAAVYLFTMAVKWANEQQDEMLVWVLVFYAGNAIFNNGIYNLLFNPFLIMLSQAIGNEITKYILRLKIKVNHVLRFRFGK